MTDEVSRDIPYDYDAFISYRRADGGRLANWIRAQLQRYRLPAQLADGPQKALTIYLDTAFERATEDFWANNIEPALHRSRFLIVVCTPAANLPRTDGSKSWVEREIELFTSLPQGRNLLVVSGRPDIGGRLPGMLSEKFPAIDIVDMTAYGHVLSRLRGHVLLKDRILLLAAPLYGITTASMPILRQEEEGRRRRIAYRVALSAFMLTGLLALLSIVALQQRSHAITERELALSRQLAAQSEMARTSQAKLLDRSALLAIESARHASTLESDQAVRKSFSLLAPPVANLSNSSTVYSVAFSRTGGYLATGSSDGELKVYQDFGRRDHFSVHFGRAIRKVVFSPDSGMIAAASADSTVRIFDVVTGRESLKMSGDDSMNTIDFDPTGTMLATGSESGVVNLIAIPSGQVRRTLKCAVGVQIVKFSPDKRVLVVGDDRGTVTVVEVRRNKMLSVIKQKKTITGVAFSGDGRYLISGSWDGTARVSQTSNGKLLYNLAYESQVYSVDFSRSGKFIATGDNDGTARLFELDFKTKSARQVASVVHDSSVYSVRISNDERFLLTGSEDWTARIYDIAARVESGRLVFKERVLTSEFDADSSHVAAASDDHVVRVFAIYSPSTVWRFPAVGEPAKASLVPQKSLVAFDRLESPDQLRIYAYRKATKLVDLHLPSAAFSVRLSRDGQLAAVGTAHGGIQLVDVAGRRLLWRAQIDIANSVAFNADGGKLAVAHDAGVNIFRTVDGSLEATIPSDKPVYDVAFSGNGEWLSIAGVGGCTRLFLAIVLKEIERVCSGQTVNRVAFTSSGRFLATDDDAHVLRVYDTTKGLQKWQVEQEDIVSSMSFSFDDRSLATTDGKHVVHVYEVESGAETSRIDRAGKVIAAEIDAKNELYTVGVIGDDIEIRAEPVRMDDLLLQLCSRLNGMITREEWQQYCGNRSARAPLAFEIKSK